MTTFKKLVEITYGDAFEKPSWWDDYKNEPQYG